MSTNIQWTDETWNPIRAQNLETQAMGWHCERISKGCENCYAETLNQRQRFGTGTGLPYTRPSRDRVDIALDAGVLEKPLRWRKSRRVFVCSMTDLFGEWVPDVMLDRVFAVMALTPHITYQVLTKRPERMREYLNNHETPIRIFERTGNPDDGYRIPIGSWVWPLRQVWLGVSVEDQRAANKRIPILLDTPAAVRFLSCEPLLGPVAIKPWLLPVPTIDWVIVGGESGPGARLCNIEWVRSLVGQCKAAQVPVFVKQLGSRPIALDTELWERGSYVPMYVPMKLRHSHGGDQTEWPKDLRVREFPQSVRRGGE